ncbi:MAG: LCP family protein [Propionibacteriaceae bacterium]|jgi:LCP family protein required for cell wall assembly|nr:LCP family protein [Propionibacteriaceae bacterium]
MAKRGYDPSEWPEGYDSKEHNYEDDPLKSSPDLDVLHPTVPTTPTADLATGTESLSALEPSLVTAASDPQAIASAELSKKNEPQSVRPALKILNIFGKAFSIVMAGAVAYAIYSVVWLNIFPKAWTIGGVVGAVALVCGIAVGVWFLRPQRHPVFFSIFTVFSVAVTIVALYGVVVMNAFSTAIGDMSPPKEDNLLYDVLVFKEHSDELSSLENESVGYLKTDRYASAAQELLNSEVHTNYSSLDDLTAMTNSLRSGNIEVALLEDSLYRSFQDADQALFSALKVLKILWVPIDISSNQVEGDVSKPFVVYISGIDQYGELNPRGLSDVNMLVVVNPDTGHILMVNTPRDYYIQLHDTSGYPDKLTHAGTYGVDMSIQSLQDLYGINIDFWVRVNFDSVVRLIDALGGVDVNSVESFNCIHGGFAIKEGVNHMSGEQALCFARERYSVEGGDNGRGKNQQRLLSALIDKMISPSILVNYGSMLEAINGRLQMSFSADDIAMLVRNQLSSAKNWKIDTTAVIGSGSSQPTYTYGSESLYVMLPDWTSVAAAATQIKDVLAER